ncbi:MAG: DUF86 domain-containing protein [Rhodospirillaceae bacterium]
MASESGQAPPGGGAPGSKPPGEQRNPDIQDDRDTALLLDMLLAARDARAFVAGLDETVFLTSRLHQNAVIRSLEVIGEAAGRVSPATVAAHPDISWREITGMRHRLIHGYGDVRLDLVWTIVRDHLPPLIDGLTRLLPEGG